MKKLLGIYLLLLPAIASAQSVGDWGINDFSEGDETLNLGNKPLRETIAGVINIVLGFLGILATVGIIIGGITMMTSGGNADKKSSGQNGVVAGAIGLIIVLAAYAISRFVLASLANQTLEA